MKFNNIPWKKIGLFAGGVLFGTAGIRVLSSKDVFLRKRLLLSRTSVKRSPIQAKNKTKQVAWAACFHRRT